MQGPFSTPPKNYRKARIAKLLLTDSFLPFLEQKTISRITVKDICEYGDLSRSMCQRYFTDPYEPGAEIIDEMVSRLDTQAPKELQADSAAGPSLTVMQILDYIYSKKDMFRILLSNHGDFNLQGNFLTVLADKLFTGGIQSPANKSLLKYTFLSAPEGLR